MFAPITRPFSQNISDEAENSLYAKDEKFVLNKSAFPGDLTRNLAFLRDGRMFLRATVLFSIIRLCGR